VLRATHAAVVLAALMSGGCCHVVHWVCPCPVPRCPNPGARDTPDAVVDLLADAFRNRRIGDIYDTFHPAFVEQNGGFTETEFSVAYEKWEDDFIADAETLASAKRTVRPQANGSVLVELESAETGAYLPVLLENRPRIRVVTKNEFVPPIVGPVDLDALVRLKDGKLSLSSELDLKAIGGLSKEAAAELTSADVVSVELTDYWTVRDIDPERCKNIRFLDKLKEYLAK
jgi:hypothetical protein